MHAVAVVGAAAAGLAYSCGINSTKCNKGSCARHTCTVHPLSMVEVTMSRMLWRVAAYALLPCCRVFYAMQNTQHLPLHVQHVVD